MATKSKTAATAAQDAPQDAQSRKASPKSPALIGAPTLARIASERLGRPVNDKRVRSVARDVLPEYISAELGGQRTTYKAHRYTPAQAAAVLAAMASKGRGGSVMDLDAATAAIDAAAGQDGDA
jgi:hypothetical protein